MTETPSGEPWLFAGAVDTGDGMPVLYVGDTGSGERPARRLAGERDRFEVTAASSADDALDALRDREFDCVVAEYDLPGRDGVEFLERVRRTDPDLPFVLYADDGDEETASEAISAGVTDYLRREPGERQYGRLADRVESAAEQFRTERRTDRHQQLLETQAAAMNASIDGMAILDDEGTYRFVNRAHADVYGYEDRSAFVGNSWRMCYEQSELERFENEVLPELDATGGWRGEAVGLCKDGSTFPQELSLSRTADGGLVCVVRDITERKKRERELQAERNRLADFADIVSHDLRNPLNVAAGTLTLLEEDIEDELGGGDGDGGTTAEAIGDRVARIADAHDRMEALIDDLLSLARDGRTVEASEPVDLESVADAAWQQVETEGADRRVPTDATVCADASRLQQLLENLFRNAVVHGAPGGDPDALTVTVGRIDDGDGDREGFYVADDGRGIPPDDRKRVFDAGESSRDDGTGFGLAIVSRIADAHDWSVSVAASADGGARFDVTGVQFA